MLLVPQVQQKPRQSRRVIQNNYQKSLQKEYIDLHDHDDLEFTIQVLKREEKAKQELQYLARAFNSLKFFEEKQAMLEDNVYQQLLKKIKHEHILRDHSVFNTGEDGETYYIILRGSVTVLLPKPHIVQNLREKVLTYQQLIKQINVQKELFAKKVKNNSRRISSQKNIIRRSLAHDLTDAGSFNSRFNKNIARRTYLYRASLITNSLFPEGLRKPYVVEEREKEESGSDLQSDKQQSFREESESSKKSHGSQDSDQQIFYDEYINFVYSDFIRIKELNRGDVFGEIALVTKSKRTATIICRKDCDFLTLTKQNFDSILGEYENLIISQQVDFFKQYEFFQKFPNPRLMSLIHQMITINPMLHNTIYKENDEADKVYFIYKGEVEISKEVEQTAYEKFIQNKPQSIPNFASKIVQKRRVLVSLLTQGSVFGHEEILTGKIRFTKAVCKTGDSIIYSLNSNVFLTQLNVYSSLYQFKQWMIRQNVQRISRINSNKQATEIVKREQYRIADPPSLQANENSNVKQKYEEMTRFKMANDTKLLCEAKLIIEDKLKPSQIYDQVMIPVCDSKYLSFINNKRPRQQQNFISAQKDSLQKDKLVQTQENITLSTLDPLYNTAKMNNANLTPKIELIERLSTYLSKSGILASLLSPQERTLIDKEKAATQYAKFHHTKGLRNNFLCKYSLLSIPNEQITTPCTPNDTFFSPNLSQLITLQKSSVSSIKYNTSNEFNIHVSTYSKSNKKIKRAISIVQSMGFRS